MDFAQIEEIFKEADLKIEAHPGAENIGQLLKNGIKLYSYKPYKKKTKSKLINVISHFNPKNIDEKLDCFVKKNQTFIKNKAIYYPSIEILLDKQTSPEKFYERTRSFLKHSKYDLHLYNPIHLIIKIFAETIKTKRQKYGYETKFFFSAKDGTDCMGSVYGKDGKNYLSITSKSSRALKECSSAVLYALS